MFHKTFVMNFIELATQRSSVRDYQPRGVEREKLLQVLEASRIAPSAANFQPWQFMVITEPELLHLIYPLYQREWLTTAPVIIMALGDHDKGWHRGKDDKDFTEIDVAIAIDHLTLAATELGLGSCWICNFDAENCRKLFNLPDNLEPIALISIGYPAAKPAKAKQRKDIEQIVQWNRLDFE